MNKEEAERHLMWCKHRMKNYKAERSEINEKIAAEQRQIKAWKAQLKNIEARKNVGLGDLVRLLPAGERGPWYNALHSSEIDHFGDENLKKKAKAAVEQTNWLKEFPKNIRGILVKISKGRGFVVTLDGKHCFVWTMSYLEKVLED